MNNDNIINARLAASISDLRFRTDTHIWWLFSLKDRMFFFNDSKVPNGFEISLNKKYLKKVSLCIKHESQVMYRFLEEFIKSANESDFEQVDFMMLFGTELTYLYFRLSLVESMSKLLSQNLNQDSFFADEIEKPLVDYLTCISKTREVLYPICSPDILFTNFFPSEESEKFRTFKN